VLDLLARLVARWPGPVLAVAAAAVAVGAVAGAGLPGHLRSGGYTDPGAESSAARSILDRKFATTRPDLVLLVSAPGGVDSPGAATQGRRLTAALTADHRLEGVTSYWHGGSAELRSRDGTEALIVARIRSSGDARDTSVRAEALRRAHGGRHGAVDVTVGGSAVVDADVERMAREDLRRAELISIPITAVILVLVFGGLVAAALPLIIGLVGIVGTTASLRVVAEFTDVSVFAPNLAVGLGLGLAVDYALFIVRRQREELAAGADVHVAIRRTLGTAGRTVAFSALTVVLSMSAMLLFPMYFLRSFAYAGISVVLLAAVAALVPLPAALVLVGRRVDALDVRGLFRRGRPSPVRGTASPVWRRVAQTVTGRPVLFTVVCTALLVTLSSQVLHLEMGTPDDRTLPASAQSHQVQRHLRDDFPAQPATVVAVVTRGVPRDAGQHLGDYARRLSALPDVRRVVTATGEYVDGDRVRRGGPGLAPYATGDDAYLAVGTDTEAISPDGKRLVRDIRAVAAPFEVLVGGPSAELLDTQDSMTRLFPRALGLIAGTTLVLLFLLTGSLLLPVKALVMNVLSLGATFGVLVWIFQDGHLADLLGFQVTGWVMVQLLVLLFAVAFGVSMDYEVFLLSRINEEYDRVRDNRHAVVVGLERTGGVVTAAALITAVVFTAMASSRLTHIEMFGVGLALAVLMDAFVVRALLVPALMVLAGRANWWAPAPLRRLHARVGLAHTAGHDHRGNQGLSTPGRCTSPRDLRRARRARPTPRGRPAGGPAARP
jgi:RND superfamily putative drug exporter